MLSLITLPTPTNIITSSSEWTAAFLPEFWTLVYVAVGILVVGLVVTWIIKKLNRGVSSAFGQRRGGRGRGMRRGR